MTKPISESTKESYFKNIDFLYRVMTDFDNGEDFKSFLRDVLTPSELRMLRRRWQIACLLDEGRDIRQVAREEKVSTGTVTRIKNVLIHGRGGLVKALELTRKDRTGSNEKETPKKPVVPPVRTLAQKTRIVFG
ncbi:hypothetical protein COY33_01480 [candidate division WWE3 bacterium CG_4_10_14_0_2_um_filter_42_7]|uniref:Transcriptional regulator n=2 Tax=Katanobacteria TaxID=422282 RepID=A0A2H0XA70_UNCKA|nr:MAG: hypothetical protein COT51_00990 [candidate division WWE3 bacterium CG08_land_8_20_14_0_20_41_15]PIZ43445.1 MAG: hypothetical protein COY33_01480 [candidate division WWE3 bacterium CG_4_10_14_0_2_um_filter_42_7]